MTLPSISVIFPTYNRCDVVRRTLECLIACDYPHDLVQVIVGDMSRRGHPSRSVTNGVTNACRR